MTASLSTPAAVAELRLLARDLAKDLARQGWAGKPAAAPPSAPLKRSAGTAHARDRAKFESAFTNQILAELFEAAHSVGDLTVLRRTVGDFIVYDARKPMGIATVAGPFGDLDKADAVMRAMARGEADGQ